MLVLVSLATDFWARIIQLQTSWNSSDFMLSRSENSKSSGLPVRVTEGGGRTATH